MRAQHFCPFLSVSECVYRVCVAILFHIKHNTKNPIRIEQEQNWNRFETVDLYPGVRFNASCARTHVSPDDDGDDDSPKKPFEKYDRATETCERIHPMPLHESRNSRICLCSTTIIPVLEFYFLFFLFSLSPGKKLGQNASSEKIECRNEKNWENHFNHFNGKEIRSMSK